MADKNKNTEGIKDDDRQNITPKVRKALANQPAETGMNGYEYTNEREPTVPEKNGLGE